MPKTAWAFTIAMLWLGGIHSGNCDPGAAARGNFSVTFWDSGLPSVSVISLAQSRDGYLWLGTFDGLARFDGRRCTVFEEAELPGLSSGPVSFLFCDRHGQMWAGADAAGAKLLKDGGVRSLDIGTPTREGRLVGAAEDARGHVWLATANGELCRYRDGQIDVWGGGFGNYRALALETNGTIWLATDWELIALNTAAVQPGKDLPTAQRHSVGRVDYLLASRSGGFWLLAGGSAQKIRAPVVEREFKFYPGEEVRVLSACEDGAGNLVVGTRDRGLVWFDAHGRAQPLTRTNGLSHNTVLSLLVDREGSLWAGTDGGGLNRVKRQVLTVLPETATKTVQSVCEDEGGGLWMGFATERVGRLKDGVLQEFGPNEGLVGLGLNREPNASAVFVDGRQRVWAGTRDFGLFEQVDGRFQMVAEPRLSGPGVNVSVIQEDRAGRLWVGTQAGLGRRDERGWTFLTTTNGLTGNAVTALAEDAAGNVWIGTANGLNRWQEGQFTPFHERDGLPGEQISALLADTDGVLWVGTRGRGLARFADGRWTHFSKRDGLADERVKYLAEDAQGALWIGSSVGLIRVEKGELNHFAAGRTETVRWRVFDRGDGLLKDECSSGAQPAAWRGRDGRMWFTTILGLVSVNPAELVRNTNPPPVVIERVLVDGVLQNAHPLRPGGPGRVTIPANAEVLEIRYTSLNLGAPDRARFKYQLAGHESGWKDAGTDRYVRYSRLPPDQYRFQVKACNEDGVWNESPVSLVVTVEPPFWRTRWFMTLSAAALLGLIVATVHFISTQKLQRQLARLRQKEALEQERARIARDLHDQLGANLTQISLLGEMAGTDRDQPREVEQHARQISETARATAHALDEIVWAANPANDTLEGLATYACKYAQEYLKLAGVSCRLEVPERLPATPLPPEVRHNVFLAFKEAVNNVVKHAQATTVKVRLAAEVERFVLEIEDDGRGLAEADRAKGRNGLRNMRKRMEDVGGEFAAGAVRPPERGTRVRLVARLKPN